jgi:hypothetical protein
LCCLSPVCLSQHTRWLGRCAYRFPVLRIERDTTDGSLRYQLTGRRKEGLREPTLAIGSYFVAKSGGLVALGIPVSLTIISTKS